MHPRFAHMVLRGAELGAPELAALLAALLSERDILRGTAAAARSADIKVRTSHSLTIDRQKLKRLWQDLIAATDLLLCPVSLYRIRACRGAVRVLLRLS